MPTSSYPGVYVEETSSGVRTIKGAPTSVCAFVGHAGAGPIDEPVQVFSYAGFEESFGGLDPGSDLSYAVAHFFLNGGSEAWIVRAGPDLPGVRADKTGLFALEGVDHFNILVLPNLSEPALQAAAVAYAAERRAFVILDLPAAIRTVADAQAWLMANAALRHPNAAAYFPRLRIAGPLQNGDVRAFANSGAMAGLYARTDGARGVWTAPAGAQALIRGAAGLDYVLSDPENSALSTQGLNSIRSFRSSGPVAWGARTLAGSDAVASEWKYVPVRRLSLFLEESLYRGTQWVVFEPNDEPLWAQIRLAVVAFMHTLFRQGAFQGRSASDAYFVRCDATTTIRADLDRGMVNIVVGFAPLKPAEFVVIRLQQRAGAIQP